MAGSNANRDAVATVLAGQSGSSSIAPVDDSSSATYGDWWMSDPASTYGTGPAQPTAHQIHANRVAQQQAAQSSVPAVAPSIAGTTPTTTRDTLNLADVGWNKAILTTYPELAALFRRGVAEGWSPEHLTAQVRNTKWYKTNTETWRLTEIKRLTDPKSYTQDWNSVKNDLVAQAAQLGATLTGNTLTRAVNQVYRFGLKGQDVTKLLSTYITEHNGVMGGAAGTAQQNLRQLAQLNGVSYNDDWYSTAARGVVSGTRTAQDYENDIRTQAASAFPVYADQIKSGQNVSDIASPYVQRMSTLLELNPTDVNLFDPHIREALSGRNPDTGKAQAKSLWQFENDLRKDPRWQFTNNARQTTANVANSILQRWGLSG